MRHHLYKSIALILVILFAGCEILGPDSDPGEENLISVPEGFAPIPIPTHNPVTPAKVELGERLFFDPVLSRDGTVSCASCHFPEVAFADPRTLSVGVDGKTGLRNSPTLVNIAYQKLFFWDGGALTLENQIFGPLQDPNEMDADLNEILQRLNDDASYVEGFSAAFDDVPTLQTLTQAIAAFERTIRSGGSRYDEYINGDASALSAQEIRGLDLFNGKAGCNTCHSGFLLASDTFENNGLEFANSDSGRARITQDPNDFAKFKVPSLRNVVMTGPFMHDGRLASLEAVLDHYNAGGTGSRGQNPVIVPLGLTDDEKNDIIAFLGALSDESIMIGLEQ
ncbi:MAG: cytochrome-c peroxidase [Rhodothermales bacterium]|nr:cytochrome-c peroxidase [Rhodothermales bacterium]